MVEYQEQQYVFSPGMMQRKGVRFPSCPATVMETKADEKRAA